jgi:hypothetical protein
MSWTQWSPRSLQHCGGSATSTPREQPAEHSQRAGERVGTLRRHARPGDRRGGVHRLNLVDALLLRGHAVRVLDNFSSGHRRNLAHVEGDIELVERDLRSYERVHHAVRGCEVVFHQGALPSVPRSVQALAGRVARQKLRRTLAREQWFIAYRRLGGALPIADASGARPSSSRRPIASMPTRASSTGRARHTCSTRTSTSRSKRGRLVQPDRRRR